MIPECHEHKVKSKIGNIFVNEKILKEYSVKIYETDPCFYEHYRKRIQVEYLMAVEIDEKVILTETLFLRRKDKKH